MEGRVRGGMEGERKKERDGVTGKRGRDKEKGETER